MKVNNKVRKVILSLMVAGGFTHSQAMDLEKFLSASLNRPVTAVQAKQLSEQPGVFPALASKAKSEDCKNIPIDHVLAAGKISKDAGENSEYIVSLLLYGVDEKMLAPARFEALYNQYNEALIHDAEGNLNAQEEQEQDLERLIANLERAQQDEEFAEELRAALRAVPAEEGDEQVLDNQHQQEALNEDESDD